MVTKTFNVLCRFRFDLKGIEKAKNPEPVVAQDGITTIATWKEAKHGKRSDRKKQDPVYLEH